MTHTPRPHRPLALAATLAASLALAGAPALAAAPTSPTEAPQADLDFARSLSSAFRHAAASASPSLVHVTTRTRMTQRDAFGRPLRERLIDHGLGSGFVLSAEGHIVTNNHVVANSDDLMVRLADGRELPATLVGADAVHDIAVLRIEAGDLRPATLGQSAELEVGDWVLALGSPFGLDSTVTAGIVSAKGRGIARDEDQRAFQDYIQTDAAINPGNSGGPLIDLEGRVVGVNTAIFTRSGGSNGIGFAIPIDLARTVAQAIIQDGYADRGWLGVTMRPDPEGVRVIEVIDGSPADRAGLEAGDVIRAFRGRPIDSPDRLISAIMLTPAGVETEIGVRRDGRDRTLAVTLDGRTRADAELFGIITLREVGLRVRPVDERLPYAVRAERGAFVEQVIPGSAADLAQVQPGDVITAVDERRVDTAEDLREALEDADLDEGVRLLITRGHERGYLEMTTAPRRLIRGR